MLKSIIYTVILLFSLNVVGQVEQGRMAIEGKVNVGRQDDPQGINVFNMTSKQYTYTDKYGRFSIPVKLNDQLVFSSLQYQQFTVIITQSVIDNKKLTVNLNTGTIKLEEVVVSPDLTGDVSVDVRHLKTEPTNQLDVSEQQLVNGYYGKFSADRLSTVKNDAIDKGYLKNGINFAYLFRPLFRAIFSSKPDQPKYTFMDNEIRKLYDDTFFKRYLNIDSDQINNFIYFMEDRGLTKQKLAAMNDLELIQTLIEGSKAFKAQQKE